MKHEGNAVMLEQATAGRTENLFRTNTLMDVFRDMIWKQLMQLHFYYLSFHHLLWRVSCHSWKYFSDGICLWANQTLASSLLCLHVTDLKQP